MAMIQLSRVALEYLPHGDGPERILFTHGFLSSGRIWRLVQEALPADRYTTIAVCNRGAGASDAPPEVSDFGVEVFASDLHELVTQLGWRDFTLMGHSLGGATTTRFALDHPELLKGIVLLNPADPDGVELPPGVNAEEAIGNLVAAIPSQTTAFNVDAAGTNVPADLIEALGRDIANAPERRLLGSLLSVFAQRMGDQLDRLTMPVLFVGGDIDRMIAPATQLASWAKYPAAGLHMFHGVGHSPNLDRPNELAALLRQFIEETIPARTRQLEEA
jgi:branched-chain amino acid transport system permease protein